MIFRVFPKNFLGFETLSDDNPVKPPSLRWPIFITRLVLEFLLFDITKSCSPLAWFAKVANPFRRCGFFLFVDFFLERYVCMFFLVRKKNMIICCLQKTCFFFFVVVVVVVVVVRFKIIHLSEFGRRTGDYSL